MIRIQRDIYCCCIPPHWIINCIEEKDEVCGLREQGIAITFGWADPVEL